MDPSTASTCTSCTFSEDFSNYWTASLYFRSPENGSYKMVPQQYGFTGVDGVKQPVRLYKPIKSLAGVFCELATHDTFSKHRRYPLKRVITKS